MTKPPVLPPRVSDQCTSNLVAVPHGRQRAMKPGRQLDPAPPLRPHPALSVGTLPRKALS